MEEKNNEIRVSRLRLSLFDLKGDGSSSVSEGSGSSNELGPVGDVASSRVSCQSLDSDLNVGLELGEEEAEYNDESLSVNNTLTGERKSVSFGSVSCRLYHRTAGLHPAVSCGPALDFSWEYRAAQDTSLEEYELHRPTNERRKRTQMILPRLQREKILQKECAMSQTKIASYVRKINHTKSQRRQTLNNLRFANLQEKWQKCSRGIKRMLCIRKSYDEELKLLWSNAGNITTTSLERSLGSTWGSTNTERSTESHSSSVSLCCQMKRRKERRCSELDKGRPRIYFLPGPASSEKINNHKMVVNGKIAVPSEDKTLGTHVSELDQANNKVFFDFDEAESEENQDTTLSMFDQADHNLMNPQDPKQDNSSGLDHKSHTREGDTQNVKTCALEEEHQDCLDQSHHYHKADHAKDEDTLDQTRHGIKVVRTKKYDLDSDLLYITQ